MGKKLYPDSVKFFTPSSNHNLSRLIKLFTFIIIILKIISMIIYNWIII